MLFLTFSATGCQPEKLLYTMTNLVRGQLDREKRTKRENRADAWEVQIWVHIFLCKMYLRTLLQSMFPPKHLIAQEV